MEKRSFIGTNHFVISNYPGLPLEPGMLVFKLGNLQMASVVLGIVSRYPYHSRKDYLINYQDRVRVRWIDRKGAKAETEENCGSLCYLEGFCESIELDYSYMNRVRAKAYDLKGKLEEEKKFFDSFKSTEG